jgi:hypothetical protein
VAVLPRIPQFIDEDNEVDAITKFRWVKRIGYALIDKAEIEIGGEVMDEHYGDWLNVWHELTVTQEKNIDQMLGDVRTLTEYSNGKRIYKLFIPLQFWFNRFAGLALPIVSLQYNHIKINIEIAPLRKLYTVAPTHSIGIDNDFVNFEPFEYIEQIVDGERSLAQFVHFDIVNRSLFLYRITDESFKSVTETDITKIQTEADQDRLLFARDAQGNLVNSQYLIRGLTSEFEVMPRINAREEIHVNRTIDFNNIVLKDAFMLVEYIYLDDEERVRFSQARHEYLIEQLQFNGERTINGLHQQFKLGFTQPSKELVWVTQLSQVQNTRLNDNFNYTDSFIKDDDGNTTGNNIVTRGTLLFNGKERVSLRDINYYSNLQPYQNHTNGPAEGISVYSFSLNPEKHQVSGVANFSKIDNIRLRLEVQPQIDFVQTAKLRVYGVNYNILRIANGISGLVFSRDN